MALLQGTFIRSSKVTNHGYERMSPNKTTVHQVGLRNRDKSNGSCLWKITSKRMVAGRSILSGTPQLLRRNSKNELQSSHTSAQISAFLTDQNVELMSQPPHSPDLAHKDFFFVNDFRQTPNLLNWFFKVTVNNINDGRTSKHYEYNYA